ncbi:phosphonate degradation HD-domain oxygenase [Thalassoroseus pseudoceratinae]|uniref:phosphonate degradation HD-domain oxygenase n=1 Tax=Thalassoroseus pseudoceratinae TaxID=2713176 RepID=UPI00141ECA39|nr:phosphonate degradation HD-domain oxygenase [Thalassoroseus pseudoceratinae]
MVVEQILELWETRGDSQYGQEAVTQREHALQTAMLARQADASAELVTAALLHDVGHLLHKLPEDAPDQGIDDRHETIGARWLQQHFPPEVWQPVVLHVPAKRYLCAVDQSYLHHLSQPSVQSLQLQGGPMSPEEIAAFQKNPYAEAAVQLRRWDDDAKIVGLETPRIEDFRPELEASRMDLRQDDSV